MSGAGEVHREVGREKRDEVTQAAVCDLIDWMRNRDRRPQKNIMDMDVNEKIASRSELYGSQRGEIGGYRYDTCRKAFRSGADAVHAAARKAYCMATCVGYRETGCCFSDRCDALALFDKSLADQL